LVSSSPWARAEEVSKDSPSLVSRELAAIEAELLQTRSELRKRRVELEFLEERVSKHTVAARRPDDATEGDPEVKELEKRLASLETEYGEYIGKAGGFHPTAQALRRRIESMQHLLQVRLEKLRSEETPGTREIRDRIDYLTRLEKRLLADAESLRATTTPTAKAGLEGRLERMEAELREIKAVLKELAARSKKK
jgi:hypothetical protein